MEEIKEFNKGTAPSTPKNTKVAYLEQLNEVAKKSHNNFQEASSSLTSLDERTTTLETNTAFKYKTYKALLTQSGETDPVARVLNASDPDYLGDLIFVYRNTGVITSSEFFADKDIDLTSIVLGNKTYDNGSKPYGFNYYISESDLILKCWDLSTDSAYGGFDNTYLEITVRQRGEAPVLISAETNEDGDRIILTFDKNISLYLMDSWVDSITLSDNYRDNTILDNNVITIITAAPYTSEDTITISFDASYPIESLDLGLLEAFTDFPVTNNIVAV